jgi:hypothetical protein
MKYLLFLLIAAATVTARAADPAANKFTGHYELTKSSKSAFSLDLEQKGITATASFSASHMDGSGAAPDGDCEGQLNAKGELTFKWTDSFENGGTAVLRREGKVYHFTMKATKVEDPRALVHYGDIILKRTSTKLPTEAR